MNKKAQSDSERFARYQAVVEALLGRQSFRKPDLYRSFKPEERTFIGRVISELTREDI